LFARLAITSSLIVWVAGRADLHHVAHVVREARGLWLLLACALAALNICVGALRWRVVLGVLGVHVPARTALRFCWSGQFFNTFLPSGMAGDALRSAWASAGSDRVRATASVVLDRAVACVGLGVAVTLGLLGPEGHALPFRGAFFAAALMVAAGGAVLLASPSTVMRVLARLLSRFARGRAPRRLTRGFRRSLTGPLAGTLSRSLALGPRLSAVALALVTQALIVGVGLALARAAAVPLSWSATLAVIPAAMVTAYVPFAISGLGVRDAALVMLLGQVGVRAADAWAISLLFLITTWGVGLLGGVVFLLNGRAAERLGASVRTTRNSLLGIPIPVPIAATGAVSTPSRE